MARYFIQLSYKGTNYHGWQIQPGSVSVQSILNNTLSIVLKETIHTTGAGRTDTGVHAPFFMAHFDSQCTGLHTSGNLIYKINKFLPPDICVHAIYFAKDEWHARYSALKRTYHYLIAGKKTVFNTDLSYYHFGDLSIDEMNSAASVIMQHNDFTSFARLHGGADTSICTIYESYWFIHGDYLVYKVTANRFLRNMVRALVGTMTDIGRGKMAENKMNEIIESKNRAAAGSSAKAKGLFLTSIVYPPEFGFEQDGIEYPGFLML